MINYLKMLSYHLHDLLALMCPLHYFKEINFFREVKAASADPKNVSYSWGGGARRGPSIFKLAGNYFQ